MLDGGRMKKRFNVTGLCIPSIHYMVDTDKKIEYIIEKYVEEGAYFTINRARQYGKTTTLELLYQRLSHNNIVLDISFEGREDYFSSFTTLAAGLLQFQSEFETGLSRTCYDICNETGYTASTSGSVRTDYTIM